MYNTVFSFVYSDLTVPRSIKALLTNSKIFFVLSLAAYLVGTTDDFAFAPSLAIVLCSTLVYQSLSMVLSAAAQKTFMGFYLYGFVLVFLTIFCHLLSIGFLIEATSEQVNSWRLVVGITLTWNFIVMDFVVEPLLAMLAKKK